MDLRALTFFVYRQVFKYRNQKVVVKQDKDKEKPTLTFKKGRAEYVDRHGVFFPSLKAELPEKPTIPEFLNLMDKIMRTIRPLKAIFSMEMETDLKSMIRLKLDRREILEVSIDYYIDSFCAHYRRSLMFTPHLPPAMPSGGVE